MPRKKKLKRGDLVKMPGRRETYRLVTIREDLTTVLKLFPLAGGGRLIGLHVKDLRHAYQDAPIVQPAEPELETQETA